MGWDNILFGVYDRIAAYRANRKQVSFVDAYGWAYTDVAFPDITRVYIRGTFVNSSDKSISLLSIQLSPARNIHIAAKEAPFLILGVNDTHLMTTSLPLSVGPLASCKVDSIFHCLPTQSASLHLPSVGVLSQEASRDSILFPCQIGPDSSGIQWKVNFLVKTSRGTVSLRPIVDWRAYTDTYSSLSAIDRISRDS